MRVIERLEIRAVGADKQRIAMRCSRSNAWEVLERVYRASGTGVLYVGVVSYGKSSHNGSQSVTGHENEASSDASQA